MAWRLKMKARKAPPGMEKVQDKLQEFEARTRDVLNTPADDKRRNEITWPMHKLHYEKNRYLYDMQRRHEISKPLLDYLIHEKIADGKLIAKWRRPGYETLCSLLVITKKNTNFGAVGVCRVKLKDRRGQILPNVLTGCVSCASGDRGPIWWDDPIPDVVKQRILQIDPGKADLVLGVDAPRVPSPHSAPSSEPALTAQNDPTKERGNPGGGLETVQLTGAQYSQDTGHELQAEENQQQREVACETGDGRQTILVSETGCHDTQRAGHSQENHG